MRDLPDNPLRLTSARVREQRGSDDWTDVGWDQAIDRVAAAIRAAGPGRTAIWAGHGAFVNTIGSALSRRLAAMIGAQWWVPSIVCWGLGGFGVWLTGVPHVNSPIDLEENAGLILLWGANLASQPTTGRRLTAARRRGARIVAIDVRRTEACDFADDFILVRPGTDAALALGMMNAILAEGLHDADFVASHTVGFEQLAAHLEGLSPDWAAAETGVPADRIRSLAREYAASRRALILLGGSSMNKTANQWHAARAISCLPALTGNLGRPGAGMGPRHGAGPQATPLRSIVPPSSLPGDLDAPTDMETILERIEAGSVEVLLLPGNNMLSSFADTGRVERALARTKLVVCFDLVMSDTSRAVADIVLPGTSWLEETGLKLGPTHVHLMEQAIEPRGDARPQWRLYADLAERLGVEGYFPWPSLEALIDEILDSDYTQHVTVADLRREGPSAPLAAPTHAYADLRFPTPSGHVELFSQRAVDLGLPGLPVYEPAERDQLYPLTFVQGRTLTHFHSFYDHGQVLPDLAKADPEPVLWISPADARDRSVEDGEMVTITGNGGRLPARARVTERQPAGSVWMHDGWMGINRLTDSGRSITAAAIAAYPQGGSSRYEARVEVAKHDPASG